MRIDIQKEINSKYWEEYKKEEIKAFYGYLITSIIASIIFVITIVGVAKAVQSLNNPEIGDSARLFCICIMPIIVFMGFLIIACFNCMPERIQDIKYCDYRITWLNDHKEYNYAEGSIYDSLETCKLIKEENNSEREMPQFNN